MHSYYYLANNIGVVPIVEKEGFAKSLMSVQFWPTPFMKINSNFLYIRKFTNSQQIIINNSFFITLPLDVSLKIDSNNNLEINYWDKALKGTLISNIKQSINGPYEQTLKLEGVGYKLELIENSIKCTLGFSHPVIINIPSNIKIELINNKEMKGISNSLQDLTNFIQKIYQIKPAYKDKYKNKGFKLEKKNLGLNK